MLTHTAGWFDAFRENGGPTLYMSDNRTSVSADRAEVLVYLAFVTLLVAFLAVVPGIRKERCTTVFCVSSSLLVGAAILIGVHGTSWHVGRGQTVTYYRAFSRDRIPARLGVYVGLSSVNVTYAAVVENARSNETLDINFNEEFWWPKPTSLRKEYYDALVKGLPFPILTVLDYLSQDSGGFLWGRMYRAAGGWAQLFLWASFAAWLLANVLLCAVPRYGAYTLQLTGALMVVSTIIYSSLLPDLPLVIPLEGDFLQLSMGWNFWLVLIIGILAIILGGVMALVDILYPSKFPTVLEVDYDTPYRYFVAQGNTSRNTSAANSTANSPVPLPKYHKMGSSEEYRYAGVNLFATTGIGPLAFFQVRATTFPQTTLTADSCDLQKPERVDKDFSESFKLPSHSSYITQKTRAAEMMTGLSADAPFSKHEICFIHTSNMFAESFCM
ncbi:unnamed protein product, partial [Ixodes pacificus]